MSSYIGNAPGLVPYKTGFVLSGSTNGQPLAITATTAGAANTIHAGINGALDLPNVYAFNNSASLITLYIQVGTTATASTLTYPVPSQDGVYLDLPGVPFTSTMAISGWASATAGLYVIGGGERMYV